MIGDSSSKARFMTSAQSSGAMRAPMAVESTTSAKRVVTNLRSPARWAGRIASGGSTITDVGEIGRPHAGQKRAVEGSVALHLAQVTISNLALTLGAPARDTSTPHN